MFDSEEQKLLQEYEQIVHLARAAFIDLPEQLDEMQKLGEVLDRIRDLSEQLELLQEFESEDQEPLPGWTV